MHLKILETLEIVECVVYFSADIVVMSCPGQIAVHNKPQIPSFFTIRNWDPRVL